jgi:hypothetical protein
MKKITGWMRQLRYVCVLVILCFTAWLAALPAASQSTNPATAIENRNSLEESAGPSSEQRLLEAEASNALHEAMDQWVDNPGSNDAKEACVAAAKQLSTQGHPSAYGYCTAVVAFEVLGETTDAVGVLRRMIAEQDDILADGANTVGVVGRLWLARLVQEQGQDDEAMKLITEAEAEMKKLGVRELDQKYCRLLRGELYQKKGNKAAAEKELQGVSEKSDKAVGAPFENFLSDYVKTRGKSVPNISASPDNVMLMMDLMVLMGYRDFAPDNLLGEKRAILWDKRYEKEKKTSCFQFNIKMLAIQLPVLNPTSAIAAKELADLVKEDPYLAPLAEQSRALQAELLGKTAESDAIFEQMKQTWKEHASLVDQCQREMKKHREHEKRVKETLQELDREEELRQRMHPNGR